MFPKRPLIAHPSEDKCLSAYPSRYECMPCLIFSRLNGHNQIILSII